MTHDTVSHVGIGGLTSERGEPKAEKLQRKNRKEVAGKEQKMVCWIMLVCFVFPFVFFNKNTCDVCLYCFREWGTYFLLCLFWKAGNLFCLLLIGGWAWCLCFLGDEVCSEIGSLASCLAASFVFVCFVVARVVSKAAPPSFLFLSGCVQPNHPTRDQTD